MVWGTKLHGFILCISFELSPQRWLEQFSAMCLYKLKKSDRALDITKSRSLLNENVFMRLKKKKKKNLKILMVHV